MKRSDLDWRERSKFKKWPSNSCHLPWQVISELNMLVIGVDSSAQMQLFWRSWEVLALKSSVWLVKSCSVVILTSRKSVSRSSAVHLSRSWRLCLHFRAPCQYIWIRQHQLAIQSSAWSSSWFTICPSSSKKRSLRSLLTPSLVKHIKPMVRMEPRSSWSKRVTIHPSLTLWLTGQMTITSSSAGLIMMSRSVCRPLRSKRLATS